MGTITTTDGTEIFYKDWGSGQPIDFIHGWPLSGDDWDTQMLFFLQHGVRCRGLPGGPRRRPWLSVSSRTWCSCWIVQGGPDISPRESHRRTTGGVILHAAAAWRIEVTRSASLLTRILAGVHPAALPSPLVSSTPARTGKERAPPAGHISLGVCRA
jgi:hypothetical protein